MVRDGKVLLQRKHNEAIWAVPGGKVEGTETPEDALAREWMEELGQGPVIGRLLWIFRNQFTHHGVDVEQTEYFFEIEASAQLDVARPVDGSLVIAWFSRSELTRIDFRPAALRDRIFSK